MSQPPEQQAKGTCSATNSFQDPLGQCCFPGNCVCAYSEFPRVVNTQIKGQTLKKKDKKQEISEKCPLYKRKKYLESKKESYPPFQYCNRPSHHSSMSLDEFVHSSLTNQPRKTVDPMNETTEAIKGNQQTRTNVSNPKLNPQTFQGRTDTTIKTSPCFTSKFQKKMLTSDIIHKNQHL